MRSSLWWIIGMVVVCNIGHAQTTAITIDAGSPGRVFEGIGALSAGASSRLLADYTEVRRGEILDVLFKPKYAASLQHLKVEIGGDINSTDGTEPSHARSRDELLHPRKEYFERGYEWMLMKEAKRRNPGIILDALQWGAPGWIGEHDPGLAQSESRRFFSQDNGAYITGFLKGAKKYHGLDIEYCGIWNETPYDVQWIKRLRRTLDVSGLKNVRIVAADQTPDVAPEWKIAEEILADEELADAVHTIGAHYTSSTSWKHALSEPFASTAEAKMTGKPLWGSEDGPWRGDWEGARVLAKIFNRSYVVGRMTKTIFWSLISSYYDNLPIPGSGPMKANTPWSGSFEIQPAIWAIAHTTQFAQPGWKYLDRSCGLLGGGGSYVTLIDPSGKYWSMIVETMDAQGRQTVSLMVPMPMASTGISIWRTTEGRFFEKQPSPSVSGDSLTIELEPNAIYSLTTSTGQQKGTPRPTAQAASGFPPTYRENFESTKIGTAPKYFSDLYGAFETRKNLTTSGRVLMQIITGPAIEWPLVAHRTPRTIIGAREWADYEVACDVSLADSGWAEVGARFDKPWDSGYWLQIQSDGSWRVSVNNSVPASGNLAETVIGKWRRLKVRCEGDHIGFFVGNHRIASLRDTSFSAGVAGLGTGWNKAYFDNFEVTPIVH